MDDDEFVSALEAVMDDDSNHDDIFTVESYRMTYVPG